MIQTKNKITVRYIIMITPVLFGLMVILTAVVYLREQKRSAYENEQTCKTVTGQAETAIRHWMEDQVRMAAMIAGEPAVIAACENPQDPKSVLRATEYLQRIHEQYPYYENISLAVRLKPEEKITVSVAGEEKTIRNGYFFTDTVKGKILGKGGMRFSFIRAAFEGKNCYISEVYPGILKGEPVAAVSVPVKKDGFILGAAVISPQMSYITDRFVSNVRLGRTGYLCFADGRGMMISHPDKTYILNKELAEKSSVIRSKVLSGEYSFTAVFDSIRKKYFFRKVDFPASAMEYEWYVTSVQESDEIFENTLNFLKILAAAGILSFLIVIASAVAVTRFMFVRPIRSVWDAVQRLADFDLSVNIAADRKDEIGAMMKALNRMVSEFRKIVSDVRLRGSRLAEASALMTRNISALASASEEISANTRSAADIAKLMLQSNTTVASAVEEMSASINQVGMNAYEGSRIAEDAVAMAEKAKSTMTSLGDAADEIGEVTELIKRIADKTALLALNADIEAASAGEAGRGFAVVANEIKEFALQSTRAADDIAARISVMQENTEQAVAVIGDVSGIIGRLNTSSKIISQALEEQMKAANEIASHAAASSHRANDIASAMGQLTQGMNEVSMNVGRTGAASGEHERIRGSQHITGSAAEVSRLAAELLESVKKFKME